MEADRLRNLSGRKESDGGRKESKADTKSRYFYACVFVKIFRSGEISKIWNLQEITMHLNKHVELNLG